MCMHDWRYSQKKALEKQLYRSIQLCRTSIDYRLKYPSEAKSNPKNLVLKEAHPEAIKRITHDFNSRIRNAFQPSVKRPARLNRVV